MDATDSLAKLKIATLNVRGLNNDQKRKTILKWCKDKNIDIACFQESFLTENSKQLALLRREWSGDVFVCPAPSPHSCGVITLLKHKLQCEVISKHVSNDGRKLLLNMKIDNKIYTVVNVYAPNLVNTRKDFFKRLSTWIKQKALDTSSVIICGDLNCALHELDKESGELDQSSRQLSKLLDYNDCVDGIRYMQQDVKIYTYRDNVTLRGSKLDYIALSKTLCPMLRKYWVEKAPKAPDHKAIIYELKSKQSKGPGYWKINNSIIGDPVYKDGVKNSIHQTKEEFQNIVDSQTLWDICKIRIREFSISFCKSRSKNRRDRSNELQELLKKIVQKMLNANDGEKGH